MLLTETCSCSRLYGILNAGTHYLTSVPLLPPSLGQGNFGPDSKKSAKNKISKSCEIDRLYFLNVKHRQPETEVRYVNLQKLSPKTREITLDELILGGF